MEKEPGKNSAKKHLTDNEIQKTFSVVALAWELGYIIAIPLVALTLGGRFLDKKLGTSPLLLLVGVVLAIVSSTYAIWRKMSDIIGKS